MYLMLNVFHSVRDITERIYATFNENQNSRHLLKANIHSQNTTATFAYITG